MSIVNYRVYVLVPHLFNEIIYYLLTIPSLIIHYIYYFFIYESSSLVNSAIWIIRQYSSTIQENEAAICSSGNFICSTGTPRHITKIIFQTFDIAMTGLVPDPLLTEFDFPEVDEIQLTALLNVRLPNTNILNLIKNMPLLGRLSILSDASVTLIPDGFVLALPALKIFHIESVYVIQDMIPFNFGPVVEEVIFSIQGTVTFDATIAHTNLNALSISMQLTSPLAITITDQAFPVLQTLGMIVISTDHTFSLTLGARPTDLNFQSFLAKSSNLIFNYPDSVAVSILGPLVTISPPLIDFINLRSLLISGANYTEFPLAEYPESLQSLASTHGNLTTIPNIPFKNVQLMQFQNNKLQDIPWNIFTSGNPNIILDVRYNPTLVTTTIPQSFCKNSLRINGCPSITNLPDCFKCYKNDPSIIQTDIVVDPSFICPISFYTTTILTVGGLGEISGENIGFGNNMMGNGISLNPIIPNSRLRYYDTSGQSGPARTVTLSLNNNYPDYQYDFSVLEVGISLGASSLGLTQLPSETCRFYVFIHLINPTLPHTVKINHDIDCVITSTLAPTSMLYCNTVGYYFAQGQNITFTVSNAHYSVDSYFILQNYFPSNVELYILDTLSIIGTRYAFNGYFGASASMSDVVVSFNGDISACSVTWLNESRVECTQAKTLKYGMKAITVSIYGFSSNTIFANLTTPQSECLNTGCSGHGSCDINGTCICDTGYYSVKCSEKYPTFRSGSYDLNDRKLISIYGDFGPFNQTIVSITLNSTDCQVTSKSQTLINCTLVSEPTDGLALVRLTVDNSTNNGNNWIYFKPSSQSSGSGSDSDGSGGELTCPFNCYGHGQCINGKCKCDTGYSSIDNCLTKTSNHTNTPNTTSPTTSFDIDGIDFQFEMIAIQEIDTDDNIINQVLTNSWNSTLSLDNQTQTTTVNYQLNNSDTTALVTATISFSQQPRDIQFGSQLLHIDANSIKLSVNISNWTFNTFLTTLRVIFKTTINNDQSIEFDCQDVNIDTLSYDQLSNSIQYLRVVKDNIQFTGRFIDYVLSDGRPTFSKTSIINKTASLEDQSQSTILIGISMPQCQSCSLDPDFTPLLIDKSDDSGCSKSNTWRIIVGVVVGVFGAVAIAVGSIILIKKKRVTKRHNKNMQQKLARMSLQYK
ncbi:hypothetical protein DFA_09558 [Cavenderia fasciculata]|uniref:EGF-like domain-containing protein n=1 Tax=Cavenderia fasciculata TaxID=261658 RepID=F4Q7Y9_CACFS|nr:uncharacterized protein DFA_09558 [Cavenderia fasciculata]EGG15889.1 hypothetical protein DFA_09558 [Cavenderia fasciculata]|eukprot:XP_004352214.1 hypothetical protein DFA_09558 [Cavenderia fasciculata]